MIKLYFASNIICTFDMKMGGEIEGENYISSRVVVNTERAAEASSGVQNQTSSGNSCRTVRLFGVDLECKLEESLPEGPNHEQQGEPQPQYDHPQSSSNATTTHQHVSHYQNHVVSPSIPTLFILFILYIYNTTTTTTTTTSF